VTTGLQRRLGTIAGTMASTVALAYKGVWGRSPQRGLGAQHLVESTGEATLKLKAF